MQFWQVLLFLYSFKTVSKGITLNWQPVIHKNTDLWIVKWWVTFVVDGEMNLACDEGLH